MPEKDGNAEIDVLNAELSTSQATAASRVPFPHASALFRAEGDIHPGSKLNPTKATPSLIEVFDSGPATILTEGTAKKLVLKGRKLKGTWILAPLENSELLTVQKAE